MNQRYICSKQGGCNRGDCGQGLARTCKGKQELYQDHIKQPVYTQSQLEEAVNKATNKALEIARAEMQELRLVDGINCRNINHFINKHKVDVEHGDL